MAGRLAMPVSLKQRSRFFSGGLTRSPSPASLFSNSSLSKDPRSSLLRHISSVFCRQFLRKISRTSFGRQV
jgi:hypothetical protein